jgi:2,3-bisphosphoglycerate-independent phosphoglycerate mutase
MSQKKTVLAILDGWGIGSKPSVDAIAQADTPFYDHLMSSYPSAELITYGTEVGLPEGQMGNSEVGHLNIGAGRIVYQDLARINKAISDHTLLDQQAIVEAIQYARDHNKPVHFIGLLSDGGVHAHIDHLIELINGFSDQGVQDIRVHSFLDGRDTAPDGGARYLKQLKEKTAKTTAQLVSVIGRYYAMDRDMRWERIKKAYDLLTRGIGQKSEDIIATVEDFYDKGITDEFMEPIITDQDKIIRDGDVVFFINYRTDRPREITMALTQDAQPDHDMTPLDLHFVTMTQYSQAFKGLHVVFKKDLLSNTIGEVLSWAGKTQVRIAETEKYPHVTFFFNGGREAVFEGEHRILVPSPKVATYDLQPEMSAGEVTDKICAYINSDTPDFICLNYANADMVGHTGDFSAAQSAVTTVDASLKRLVETALALDYHIIVIADHGNSDFMINEDGSPHTAHTLNPVPIIYVANDIADIKLSSGKLADIAPTLLSLMDIDRPVEMTGDILLS